MSRSLRDHTLADYVVVAISPALIVTLIGSLVYFLLEVTYQGEFQGRMRWILSFFVFGSVLVARVAMHPEAAPRAPLYSLILAGAAWVGLGMFVEYPPDLVGISWVINLGFVGLVWWSARKLTWDCTYINDEVDAGRSGLLEESGLEKGTKKGEPPAEEDEKLNWWERFVRYRDAQRKKHAPGTWVVYFSLAALPIFGLGQSLIPAEEEGRRRYTFLLMAVYVASGLGLLLTTCFLGLRRYLRQRNLKMPAKMVGSWLTLGGGLIAVLLLLGAVLPRPNSETSLVDLTPLGSKKRNASKQSFVKDGGGKDKGQPGDPQQQKDGPAPGKDAKGGNDGKGQKDGQGKDQNKSQGGDQKDGKGGSQKDADQKNGGQKGQQRAQDQKKGGEQKNNDGSSSDREEAKSGKDQKQKPEGSSSSPPPKSLLPHLPQMGQLSTVLKWVVFGALAAVVVFCLLRSGLQWLANFTKWARALLDSLRAFWARLFGRREGEANQTDAEPAAIKAKPPRPFSSFRNPFDDGTADRLPPGQVIRYSFMALQAWARERDLGRPADETPLEFAARVGADVPALEEPARDLATLYARAVYAQGNIPASSLEAVRQFWNDLEAIAEQPLSA
jgi:hypothetical protein